jgi:transposase
VIQVRSKAVNLSAGVPETDRLLGPAAIPRKAATKVASSMTDEEWDFFCRYVETEGRGRPPSDHRRVLDAIFLVALTGHAWRDMPGQFGNWGSVYQQFRRWTKAGLWDVVLDDLEAAAPTGLPRHRGAVANGGYDSTAGRRRLREKIAATRALAHRGHRSKQRSHIPASRP